MTEGLRLRRRGIGAAPRPFERITPLHNLATEIASCTRRAARVFETIVEGFELVVSDAPILDRHIFGEERCSVALREMRLQHEVRRQEAPHLPVPVYPAPSDAIRRHEGAPATDRERRLVHLVAERERHLLGPRE